MPLIRKSTSNNNIQTKKKRKKETKTLLEYGDDIEKERRDFDLLYDFLTSSDEVFRQNTVVAIKQWMSKVYANVLQTDPDIKQLFDESFTYTCNLNNHFARLHQTAWVLFAILTEGQIAEFFCCNHLDKDEIDRANCDRVAFYHLRVQMSQMLDKYLLVTKHAVKLPQLVEEACKLYASYLPSWPRDPAPRPKTRPRKRQETL